MKTLRRGAGAVLLILWTVSAGAMTGEMASVQRDVVEPVAVAQHSVGPLSLDECIDIALKKNRFRPAARFAVEIAEAQHKQALSGYWPRMKLSAAWTRLDEDPNFVFPSFSMELPAMSMAGFNVQLPPIAVPEQDIRLMDKRVFHSSLDLVYPLYLGGKVSSIVRQADYGVQIANHEARRTDMKVIYDVKRFYYGAVLARGVHEIAKEALARLEITLDLTENVYKQGSGRVKKNDYLKSKAVVENVRSFVALLKNKEKLAKAALVNTMGLDWSMSVAPSAAVIPFAPYRTDVKELVADAYRFNPDWAKVNAGLKALEAKICEAKSGRLPRIALVGRLQHIENSYDYGMVTPENKNTWTLGVGLDLPLFTGFRTANQVREARARLRRLEEQKVLLREGIALQIQHLFLKMATAQEQQKAAGDALATAEAHRALTERAYQCELMEEKDLIESQILESLMKARYQKVLYDHIEAQAHLDFVVGQEIHARLGGEQ